ncbi:hypothetical protein PFISCL1PPCAC_10826, partial [Pristionchus fissidentatus]
EEEEEEETNEEGKTVESDDETNSSLSLLSIYYSNKKADVDDFDWAVQCICGQDDDDGEAMVGCDNCVRWQHVECLYPRTKKAPEGKFLCTVCLPRETELSPGEARAYQAYMKKQKEKGAIRLTRSA